MKKLLSFIAAGLLALGLIGCSGDLHDDVVTKVTLSESLKVIGSNSGWKDATAPSLKAETDGSYTAVVVADDKNVSFCLAEDSSTWKNQTKEAIWTGDCSSVDNGFGAYNAKTKDLTKGSTYTFKFVPNSEGKVVVTITEAKTPDYQTLEGYYVVGDFNGWGSGFAPAYLIYGGVKDPATGNVTYTTEIKATGTSITFQLSTNGWKSKLGFETAGEITLDAAAVALNGSENITMKNTTAGRPYNVVVTVATDKSMTIAVKEVKYIDVVGIDVVNYEGEAEILYFLNEWIPGNKWGWETPNKGSVSNKTASCTIASTRITSDTINVQITDPVIASGSTRPTSGDTGFWASKVADDKKTVDNPKDFKTYKVKFDCATSEFSLVLAN